MSDQSFIKSYRGNIELLSLPRTAFLCSRKIPAKAVLACYDWAIDIREKGNCVIGGFQSPIEKDVFEILIKGKLTIIIVLSKALPDKLSELLASETAKD